MARRRSARGGGGLGYGPDTTGDGGGIARSIAVKFDLLDNEGGGNNSTGLYFNGAAPTRAGSIYLANNGIDLHSGRVFQVVMNYDGTILTVTISDTVTGASATFRNSVNIPAVVGGNTAFVGFTAGTGDLTAVQDILTWTYNTTAPTNQAPAITSANAATFVVGQAGAFTVTATGVPKPTLTLGGTLPAGVLFNPTTGILSGTPAAGSVGAYTLTIGATNGVGVPALQIFTLTVVQRSGGLDFATGFVGSGSQLTYNGSAAINGAAAELTNGGRSQAGSVFSTMPQVVTSFSTRFTFRLSAGAAASDGFTFTIQGNSPTALGRSGGGLGYGPLFAGGTDGILRSVAIKFDLLDNDGGGNNSTGLYRNGAAPFGTGSIYLEAPVCVSVMTTVRVVPS